MHGRGNHSRCSRRGQAREITIAARRHALNIETREAPRAAGHEKEPAEPATLSEVQRFGRISRGHGANSPGVCQKSWGDAEADHVRKRIEFPAEGAFGFHGAGDAAIHRVEKVGDTDGARSIVEISNFSVERRENGVIPTKHVGNSAGAGKNINAPAQSMITERQARFLFLTDGIYVVEFHFAITLSPPFTCCPR